MVDDVVVVDAVVVVGAMGLLFVTRRTEWSNNEALKAIPAPKAKVLIVCCTVEVGMLVRMSAASAIRIIETVAGNSIS